MAYLIAALLGGMLVFNASATPQKAASLAETALRERFPGADVKVEIAGRSGSPVLRGKFNSIKVTLSNLEWTGFPLQNAVAATHTGHADVIELHLRDLTWNGMKVDAADFVFNDISYDWDRLKKDGQVSVTSCGSATARVIIPAASLQTVLGARLKDIESPKLELYGDQVHVTGRKRVLGVPVGFTYTARPEARNGNEIWVVNPSLKVGPEALIPLPATTFLGNINPVYVLDRERQWPFRVQIDKVMAQTNTLTMNGSLTFVPPPPPVAAPAVAAE